MPIGHYDGPRAHAPAVVPSPIPAPDRVRKMLTESRNQLIRDAALATAGLDNKAAWAALETMLRKLVRPAEVKPLKTAAWELRRQLQAKAAEAAYREAAPFVVGEIESELIPDAPAAAPEPEMPELPARVEPEDELPSPPDLEGMVAAMAQSDAAELHRQHLPPSTPPKPPSGPMKVGFREGGVRWGIQPLVRF